MLNTPDMPAIDYYQFLATRNSAMFHRILDGATPKRGHLSAHQGQVRSAPARRFQARRQVLVGKTKRTWRGGAYHKAREVFAVKMKNSVDIAFIDETGEIQVLTRHEADGNFKTAPATRSNSSLPSSSSSLPTAPLLPLPPIWLPRS